MKYFFIAFAFLQTLEVTAQDYHIYKNVSELRKSSGAKDGSVAYVLGYNNKGDGGGGLYIYSDSSSATDDGGALIKSLNSRGTWIHEVQNGIVNLKWWGIQPFSDWNKRREQDIIQEYNAAIKFIHEFAPGSELRIEAARGGFFNAYYCSETWEIKKEIVIRGNKSVVGNPLTRIFWDARDLCIRVYSQAMRVTMEDIFVSQFNDNFNWGDSTGHGIYSNAQLYIDNMRFLDLAGDGIRIESCAETNSPVYGNADFSVLKNVSFNFTNYGIYISGCDANKITIDKPEFTNTRRWGVWDNGFLGNDYKEPHFAYCGYAGNGNFTTVNYKGKYYTPKTTDEFVNKGYAPDLFPQYWREHGPIGSVPWEAAKRYWSAGTFAIVNDNAWSMITSPYTEEGQAPGILNSRSELRNGTRGTDVIGGSQSRTLFGTQYHSAFQVAPAMLLGAGKQGLDNPHAPLHLVQDFLKTGVSNIAIFQSNNPDVWLNFRNEKDAFGYLNYTNKMFRIFPEGKPVLGISSSGIQPEGISGSLDLGGSSHYWRNGYINKLHISAEGASPSSGTINLKNGNIIVKTKAATTASKIFLTVSSPGGIQGFLSVLNIVDGNSFSIQSTSKTETSTVNWFIIN